MYKNNYSHDFVDKCIKNFLDSMCKHLGVSALTGKRVKEDNDSAIKDHHLFWNYSSGFDDFSILASNNNDLKVTLMERLNQQRLSSFEQEKVLTTFGTF